MKKLTTVSVVMATVLALAFVGCGEKDDQTKDDGSLVSWSGFDMVDSVDDLDFKPGTYEMSLVADIEIAESCVCDVEIMAEHMTVREKSNTRTFTDKDDYEERKAKYKKDYEGKNSPYTFDDAALSITETHAVIVPQSMTLAEFKEEYFPAVQDVTGGEYDETYTVSSKVGSNAAGVLQMSYTIKGSWKKDDEIHTVDGYYFVTLTPQP